MKVYLIRTEPVQEVAAHPDTLQLLIQRLKDDARPAPPELGDSLFFGWSLVPDPTLARDIVHLRPYPRPTPPAPAPALE